MKNNLLTLEQIQARYGLGKNKAYLLVKANYFPSIQIDGVYYVEYKDLIEWENEHKR